MIKSDQVVCIFCQKIMSITLIPDEFVIFLKVMPSSFENLISIKTN